MEDENGLTKPGARPGADSGHAGFSPRQAAGRLPHPPGGSPRPAGSLLPRPAAGRICVNNKTARRP